MEKVQQVVTSNRRLSSAEELSLEMEHVSENFDISAKAPIA